MKKIYFLTTLLLVAFVLNAQENKEDRYYNSWRFGLNMGGMWQTADFHSTAGVAGGFTLEKGLLENKTNFFSLAIRGRGLFGNTYGLDFTRNYDVKSNPALNGSYNPSIRYDSTSSFVYNNYKTQINEGALELVIGFNRLRERTNILLNLWGGVGITGYRTNINLLDESGKMYNYYKVDSTGGSSSVLASHNDLLDGSYESYAKGSKSKNLITFSPSCGIGLGYKFNRAFSIMFEYKLTFPQGNNADLLDGIIGKNNDWIAGSKDYYHYAGMNLVFRIGGKGKSSSATNVQNYTPAPTNSVVTTNTAAPTNTIGAYTNQPVIQKPIVNINTPSYSPYNETASQTFTIFAKVYNVNQRSEVYITANGAEVKNYTWLGKSISFTVPLNIGNNVVAITATNAAGSDSKSVIINYSGIPPQVNITTPGANQHTATQSLQDVYATVNNVESSNFINVIFNGASYSSFSYNPNDKVLFMQLPLVKGTNTVQINATNKFGNDSKTQIIYYNPTTTINTPTASGARPVTVTITDPAASPYKTSNPAYLVKSKVSGVADANQVTVTLNGAQIPFNFNSGMVDFNVMLLLGNNNIVVSASNGRSKDSKSTVISYETMKKIQQPPFVTILNPQSSPETTKQPSYSFKAQVKNIIDRNQLEVKFNGMGVSNFNFDGANGIVDFSSNLAPGSNNIFEVKATNTAGSHSANGIVKHEQTLTMTICHRKDRVNFETITISESEWPAHQAHGDYQGTCKEQGSDPGAVDPDITICHNNKGLKQTITIKQSHWATHQAHGDVMGACQVDPGSNVGLDPDITICHNNKGLKQTITIKQSQWATHQAHGDVMGACQVDPGSNVGLDPDITICHNNKGLKQTITIKQSQWATHQAHGDVMGACQSDGGSNVGLDPDITVCHNENGKKQTITIKQSQWATHQSHGDVLGTCPRELPGNEIGLDPDLVICHQNGDGTQTKMTIKQSQWAAHQAHGDFQGGNCATTNTNTTIPNGVEICHKNPDGSYVTLIINGTDWAAHRAHGDILGKCQTTVVPPEDKKITICHIPPGNNQNPQTIEIPESAWPAHQAHGDTKGACVPEKKITICHIPPGNNQNPQTIEISENAWPAHQAHGDTKGACVPTNTTTNNPGGNNNSNNNPPEDKKITICHIPPGNNQNPQTIEIPESAWPAHQAHGDTKGACVPEKKITICHIPPGNNQNPQTIEISENAWPAHQAHGDTKGACVPTSTTTNNPGNGNNNNQGSGNPGNSGGNTKGGDKKITICHIPPGNNQNPQTIEIPESAWPAHEAHGDTKGPCSQKLNTGGEGKGKSLGNPDNGTEVPGRTNSTQTTTTQPEKTEEQPKLRPR
jgi:hypothetical protein